MQKKVWISIVALVMTVAVILVGFLLYDRQQMLQLRSEALEELERNAGQYDAQSIVLYNTSNANAKKLAELYGAKLRITENGRFATLTLPEGTTIRDVYAMDESLRYLDEMAADYQVQVSELITEENGERLPQRPQYAVSDGEYALQTYLDYLNMGAAWGSYTGAGVTVAVIDTGIDTDHPEFTGRISEYSYNATEDKIVKDYLLEDGSYDWSLIEDEQGHGTAVAGVIAASMNSGNVVGIAPDADILVIKADCDQNGNFYRTSDLVYGIYYAIERDARVINMSFGKRGSNPFAAATKLAYESDIICVAAAGNDSSVALTYPAADAHVISVGALDGWDMAPYSNYGENINLMAPGSTYTCQMGGGYATAQGTSLASPIVAGAIALFVQNDPYATFNQVAENLYASCYDLGEPGRDWYYGFGALDVSAFLLEARGTIHYDMLTEELENLEGIYIQGHTLQELPEPERLYAVFDGWYYDATFTQEYNYYEDKFYGDSITLYAKWANEEDGIPYTYVVLDDGTVEIRSYTGHRRYIAVPEKIDGMVVSSIGDYAFSGQTRLREVSLPTGLTRIGAHAFQNCSNLIRIEIPEQVTHIENYAFSGDVRLSTVAFLGSSRLQSIGDFAFADCGSLQQIELPAALKSINGSAFYGANALHTIAVQSGNTAFQSKNGVLFDLSGSTLVSYPAAGGTVYTIPAETVEIGCYAFAYAQLQQIELHHVTTLGAYCFAGAALEELVIPDTVAVMGDGAFSGNSNLSTLSLGGGLSSIPGSAFSMTASLKTVQIPGSIREIGLGAFLGSGLQSATFAQDSNLERIGAAAFCGTDLSGIDIPASVLEIGDKAFANNSSLTQVSFGANSALHTVGAEAFAQCWMLETVELPERLRTVGDFAFRSTGLRQVTVPAGVTVLGNGVFACCADLTAVTVEAGNTVYHAVDGVLYTLDNSTLHTYPAGKAGERYTLETATQNVAPWAFAGAANLTGVTLPEGLQQIAQYGFAYCEKLQSVHIPDQVVQIGAYAFADDWQLTEITFLETSMLPRLSFGAFAYCGITYFRVPSNVSSVAQYAFQGCCNLTGITFAENSKLESITAYMFDGCSNLQSITFEAGSALTAIQAHGLEGLDQLSAIHFGDAKLNSIGNFAFRFCEGLTALELPDTLTNIGRYAFYGCKHLTELALGENMEHIGSYAFLGADSLNLYFASETMPASLDENWDYGIQAYYTGVVAVEEAGNYRYGILTSGGIAILKYLGEETTVDLTELDLGDEITIIGGGAFAGSAVQTVKLPQTLTAIQAEAFADSALTAVSIPANVTFIGRQAFANTNIATLTFAAGSKLSVVEQCAFEGTKNLTTVTLPASVTTLGTGVFRQSGLTGVTFAEGIRITEVPQQAFADTKLTEVTLPDSVTLVNHNAFNNVQTLKKVTFGKNEGIRLMSNAFYHTGLESLHIPANVTYIGEYCFVALTNLKEFTVDANNPNYKAVDGLLLNKSGRKLIAVPAGRTGSLTVPAGVEEIGFGAFEKSQLSQILFRDDANILTFGYRAFFEANKITTITIPQSVVSIDYYAFAYCENLQQVVFAQDSRLKGIYEGAFLGCINLQDITVPRSIVEISDFAFFGCSKITQLPISTGHNLRGIYDYAFAYTGLGGAFTVPETLTDIGDYAFLGNQFTELTIPDTNKEALVIGLGAFGDCNRLERITLPFLGASYEDTQISWFGYIFGAGSYKANETYVPESLKTVTLTEGQTTIGIGGFAYCTNLESIHIPHSVSALWNDAFVDTKATYELTNTVATYWQGKNWPYRVYHEARNGHFGTGITGQVTLDTDVTDIAYAAFLNCTGLTDVHIPDSVKSIGVGAFSGCTGLTKLIIPERVSKIGAEAFMDCTGLRSIVIPDGVSVIDNATFSGCTDLESVTIPDSVTGIGYNAFYGCTSLDGITIPSGVTGIGREAFFGCSSLTQIVIPDQVDRIEAYTFADCSALRSVALPSSLAIIGEYAFSGCASLPEIVIPGGVTTIGEYAFFNCTGLASAAMPQSLTAIRNRAFYGCSGLTEITIPSGVTTIGDYAFFDCTSLRCVNNQSALALAFGSNTNGYVAYYANKLVDPQGNVTYKDHTWIETEDQFLFSLTNGKYILHAYLGNEDTVTLPTNIYGASYEISQFRGARHVVIPEGFTAISNEAFKNCTSLISISIPESVTKIGNSAFSGCANLTRVTLPAKVTDISDYAFYNCAALTQVDIPEGVTDIGDYAFYNCSNLTAITLPASVDTIGIGAFDAATHLVFSGENPNFRWVDGILYNADMTSVISVDGSLCGDIVLPEGLLTIPASAFSNCANITGITIPASVTSIGYNAFSGCSIARVYISDLKAWCAITFDGVSSNPLHSGAELYVNGALVQELVIPNGVSAIPMNAFSGCGSLTFVTIPQSVTRIGSWAFANCVSLTGVYIPEGIHAIASGVFSGCGNLTTVALPNSVTVIEYEAFQNCTGLTEIILPNQVKQIGNHAFSGCSALTSIQIPDSVTTIGQRAFANCSSLADVTVGNSVTSMGSSAFTNCVGLRQITIPGSLKKIDDDAFSGCSALERVTILDGVTEIGQRAFDGCTSLTTVLLGNCVESIANSAFGNCTSLTEITLPDSVVDVDSTAFVRCAALEQIKLSENANFRFIGGILYNQSVTEIVWASYTIAGHVEIPSGVTGIGGGAFYGRTGLTGITLPNGVTVIDDQAFQDCSALMRVIIPDSVTTIGDWAFRSCTSLIGLTLGAGVETIGSEAFYGCDNLCLIVNRSVLDLQMGKTDHGCAAKYALVLKDATGAATYLDDTYFETADHFLFSYSDGNYTLRAYLGEEDTVTLPADINGCDYEIKAFRGARYVILPDTMTSIADGAFRGWTGLVGITIPNSVTSIGDYAFDGCVRLTSVTIPDSVTSIGEAAFRNCTALADIQLSKNVTKIADTTFWCCSSLTRIVIPEGVTGIGNFVFTGCTSLTEVSFPDSLKELLDTFTNCPALRENPDYNQNGIFMVDGWLISVDADAEYLPDPQNIRGVHRYAYNGSYSLKNAVWGPGGLPSNVETLYITRIDSLTPYLQNTLTLKNIVICGSVNASDLRYCSALLTNYNVTNVTIFVEALEEDLRWDDNFPGWNNGNAVVYADQWYHANFYDSEGKLVSSTPVKHSQVIRRPANILPLSNAADRYELLGWDLNGDGVPDSIPATTTADLHAYAIIRHTHTHVYTDWRITKAATCMSAGTQMRSCAYCDHSQSRTVDALGHDEVHHAAQAATCTDIGWDAYMTCNRCGHSTYAEKAALGHDNISHAAQAATCTDIGWEAYVACSRCDYTTYVEIASLGHDEVHHTAKTPNCTEHGWDAYVTCSRCAYSTYVEKPAKGHAPGAAATCTTDQACSVCGAVLHAATGHSYHSVVTAPTCIENGYTTHTCGNCGDSYVDTYVGATGHNPGAAATCTSAQTCSVCNTVLTPAKGHSEVTDPAVAATCTTPGKTEGKHCADCGAVTVAQTATDALGHDKVAHEGKTPTCTEMGWEPYVTCARCDYSTYQALSAKGHSYEKTVTAPTCTADGYTTYTCSDCGDWYVSDYVGYAPHSYRTEVTPPTCTSEGYTTYVCTACGDWYVSDYVGYAPHSYRTEVTPPTCISEGYTSYVCTVCGSGYTGDYVGATSHDYTSVVIEPTCAAEGYTSYTCSVCGDSYDADYVAALGHTPGAAATCTEDQICTVCNMVLNGATGHSYASVTTAPTCTTEGYTTHTCSGCGASYTSDHVAALGHSDADGNILCDLCGELLGEVKVELKPEFTDEDIPEDLQDTQFDTVEKIEEEMQTQLQEELNQPELEVEDTYLYDAVLMYQDQNGNMQEADREHFPEDGKLTVTMPIPEGTDPTTHKYHVVHMFTTDAYGKTPGDVEIFTDLVAQPDGNGGYYLTFEVTGLSPIMICVQERSFCKGDHSMGDWYVAIPSTATTHGEEHRDCENCDYYESRQSNLLGDVNGDGKINTRDAKLIMQYELGLIDETKLDLVAADVNGDGRINTRDAKLIMQLELGLIEEFPIP